MKLFIKTIVENDLDSIHIKFNQELFEKLSPPLMNLKVLRFDGCLKGHEVHLEMDFLGAIKNQWISKITTDYKDQKEFYFIDEGTLLPPPLKNWKHVHKVQKISNNSCLVIDDIDFTSGNIALDYILYPALYAMFSFRIPIYKKELK